MPPLQIFTVVTTVWLPITDLKCIVEMLHEDGNFKRPAYTDTCVPVTHQPHLFPFFQLELDLQIQLKLILLYMVDIYL